MWTFLLKRMLGTVMFDKNKWPISPFNSLLVLYLPLVIAWQKIRLPPRAHLPDSHIYILIKFRIKWEQSFWLPKRIMEKYLPAGQWLLWKAVEGCHCLCYAGPTILVTIRGTMVRYPDISGLREKRLKGLTVLRCESIMADTQQQEHETWSRGTHRQEAHRDKC